MPQISPSGSWQNTFAELCFGWGTWRLSEARQPGDQPPHPASLTARGIVALPSAALLGNTHRPTPRLVQTRPVAIPAPSPRGSGDAGWPCPAQANLGVAGAPTPGERGVLSAGQRQGLSRSVPGLPACLTSLCSLTEWPHRPPHLTLDCLCPPAPPAPPPPPTGPLSLHSSLSPHVVGGDTEWGAGRLQGTGLDLCWGAGGGGP